MYIMMLIIITSMMSKQVGFLSDNACEKEFQTLESFIFKLDVHGNTYSVTDAGCIYKLYM